LIVNTVILIIAMTIINLAFLLIEFPMFVLQDASNNNWQYPEFNIASEEEA